MAGLPSLIGDNVHVQCVDGRFERYVNLDYAASTPVMADGTELFVDAAQLAGHNPIDMAGSGVDHLALSGHKLYAPFGAGALVARGSRLRGGAPLLHGGGAVKLVTLDEVVWADAPERHEAGSPNVVGVVALAAACRRLRECGMEAVLAHEQALARRLW